MDKDALEAKILLAKTQAHRKAYDSALETFEQVRKSFTTQDNTIDDPEYFYLYGETLESKNLFSQAIDEYDKVTGTLQKDAKERIALLKKKEEEVLPAYIRKLTRDAKDFMESMPEQPAITLLSDIEIEVIPQNSYSVTQHYIEQILNEEGKHLANQDISYISTYEKVELEFARSISQDGKIVYANKDNFPDVAQYPEIPLYSEKRTFNFSVPAADVHSFIEYKFKTYSTKIAIEDGFYFSFCLRLGSPIFNQQFKLIVPQAQKVYFKLFNEKYAAPSNPKPTFEKKHGKTIYIWKNSKVEPIIPEPFTPPLHMVMPVVIISSSSSWKEILKDQHSLFRNKLTLDKELQDVVKNIVKSAPSYLEKAKKVYEFCAKNIHYAEVNYGKDCSEPNKAQQILMNCYGDCQDQTVILMAMLKHIGIKAYPVFIAQRDAYPIIESFPSSHFNHVICAIEHQCKFIFMDPTGETVSFGNLPLDDQDRLAIVLLKNRWQFIQTPQTEDNEISYQMHIALDGEEGATIAKTETRTGYFAPEYHKYLKESNPSQIKKDIQEDIVSISPFSQFLNYEIQNIDDFDKEPVLAYTFGTKHFLKPAGNLRIVPPLTKGMITYDFITKEERTYPIDFQGIFANRFSFTITLPNNLSIKSLPGNSRLENEWFTFNSLNKSHAQEVSFKKEFVIKKRFVEPSEYRGFKSQLEKVLYLLEEQVILEKVPS